MIYEGSLLPNVVVNHQRQYDSSNSELNQGTKPSKQTPGKSMAPSVVGNTETKTPNDTCDNPIITADTLNQDGDVANGVAYRTVSSVVVSEIKMLNNTCDKPVITNHDVIIANEVKAQLNSNTTSGQYLDFSGKSTQPTLRSDNTKISKKNTSRAQKHWLTRLSTHTRKQGKCTPKSKQMKRAHRIMSRKIGKLQTKQNVYLNYTTELLTFCHTLTSNCISPSDVLPFLSRLLLKGQK